MPTLKPRRAIAQSATSVKVEDGEAAEELFELKLEQEGFDMEFTMDSKE